MFVDYIARLENIKKDWKNIASHINCPPKLPHQNRTKHKPYQEYYDKEAIRVVNEVYGMDIKLLGYKFKKWTVRII